ncbi:MAG: LacI family DNA-binding transcriptional regulator [Planctomycetota bacterium]|nr:LacI family DNA-binding transcriptional regulator [Planctomycetota bacterium]
MNTNTNVTIRQIAQKLNVSPMTVSYALRGRGRIGRSTRERVLQMAHELGYRPNSSARATRTGRFGCVGLLVCSDSHFSYMPQAMLWGIQKTLEENDIHLTLASLPVNQPVTPALLPKILREGMVDGMLINFSHQIPPTILEAVATCRIPAVWMNCKLSSDCVYPDDRGAARMLTQEMFARGHRRIAYMDNHHTKLAKDMDRHYSEFDRMAGYSEAVSSMGMPPQIVQPPDELSEVEKTAFLRAWLEQDPRPTGVITYRTSTARLAGMAAASLGLRVPQDIEIATFSDWPNEDYGMGLRSYQIPFFEMGCKSVQMLLSKIARPSVPLPAQAISYMPAQPENKAQETTAASAVG